MIVKNKLFVLGALVAIITVLFAILIFQHRLPIAHDTGHYLTQQYVYFNELAKHGSVPFWFPFIHQGFACNYNFTSQFMILAPVTYTLALLTKGVNYLYLFFGGVWFDEIYFMIGMLLLGSFFYKRRATLFFVGVTAFGVAMWYPQIFWGMHLFYFIPMVLFCFHRFLDEGQVWYLWGALLAFWVGFIGNALYTNIFVAFILLVYVLTVFVSQQGAWVSGFKAISRINGIQIICFCLLLLTIGVSLSCLKLADNQMDFLGVGRTSGNVVPFDVFMQYGGGINIAKYWSFFDRSNVRFLTADLKLYAGFACGFLAMCGIVFSRQRMRWPLVWVMLVLILFSSATFVSKFFYYCFPMGHVFRHIGLTATVTKLFMILLAGFGMDVVLSYLKDGKFRALIFWGGLLILFVFLCRGFNVLPGDPLMGITRGGRFVLDIARYFLLLLTLMVGVMGWRAFKYRYKAWVFLLLAVISLELFAYKYATTIEIMPRVSSKVIDLFNPADYAYAKTRVFRTEDHFNTNERLKTLWPILISENQLGRLWSAYDTLESFFFADTFQSSLRGDLVLVSTKKFFMAASAAPKEAQAQVYLQYAGVLNEKIRVFSQLNYTVNDEAMARIFNQPGHNANSIWTTEDQLPKVSSARDKASVFSESLSTGNAVDARISVNEFSFNKIVLDVDTPPGAADRPYFLYYAGAYHPFWSARVNGRDTPVIRANIGYMAFAIPSGHSEVVLVFGHPLYTASVISSLILCLAVLAGTGFLAYRHLMKGDCA